MTRANRRPLKERARTPFPRQVRLWHFVVLPAVAMGVVLLLARLLGGAVAALGPAAVEVYEASRAAIISVVMASLIAWLAIRYRRQYERALQARNKALEETRDFLASIIEGSGEAIVTLDADDRITSWNEAAESIFGWSAEEMVGQSVERVLPPDEEIRAHRRDVEARLRRGETVRDVETTRLRKDGTTVVVRMTRSPLYDASGRFVGSCGIVLDVTEEKEMRTRLVEQERLAAVGELAAQVAHEIRNPLAGIHGACELIFSGYAASDPHSEVGREVLRQIDRLNRTVEELLLFARPQALHRTPTDLHDLIDRVLGMVKEDPRSKAVVVRKGYDAALPLLEIDPRQMEQVLFNVVLNAVQIMDHRGTITVETALRDGQARVTIRDSGPGISAEAAGLVFKPFFTTRAQGTGLGLALVKKIVLAHRGTVTASNAEGGGAEFCIRLPATHRTR